EILGLVLQLQEARLQGCRVQTVFDRRHVPLKPPVDTLQLQPVCLHLTALRVGGPPLVVKKCIFVPDYLGSRFVEDIPD
ncbi:hypothetical protein, partial [Escherichia coli]|uniref:hypothetical protein n=1 Tax=Escherichia coli TaxID=562 RepID=UPI0015C1379A